jgi:1-deoxy-D-xylulose-5-phosphate synthase
MPCVLNLGLPDRFVDHGRPQDLLSACGLDAIGILTSVQERLARLRQA